MLHSAEDLGLVAGSETASSNLQDGEEDEDAVVGAAVVQEVKKSFSNQKVASSIPCRSVLEQDTEPLIAPDVQCVKCKMCIHYI